MDLSSINITEASFSLLLHNINAIIQNAENGDCPFLLQKLTLHITKEKINEEGAVQIIAEHVKENPHSGDAQLFAKLCGDQSGLTPQLIKHAVNFISKTTNDSKVTSVQEAIHELINDAVKKKWINLIETTRLQQLYCTVWMQGVSWTEFLYSKPPMWTPANYQSRSLLRGVTDPNYTIKCIFTTVTPVSFLHYNGKQDRKVNSTIVWEHGVPLMSKENLANMLRTAITTNKAQMSEIKSIENKSTAGIEEKFNEEEESNKENNKPNINKKKVVTKNPGTKPKAVKTRKSRK